MNIKSETITKIAAALVKAQSEMSEAKKDSNNPFFKSKYSDLNSVREAVTPALHKHGICILQLNATVDGKAVVRTTLLHESGEYIGSDTDIVCVDAKPQTYGSAISYARRYGLSSMLSVGSTDDDGEMAQGRTNKPTVTRVFTNETPGTPASSATPPVQNATFGSFRKPNGGGKVADKA